MTTRKTLLGAAIALGLSSTAAYADTALKALFMSQSAYSEADVRAMTDAYTASHPGTTVTLEFVPYEGLRDKTILAQGSGDGYDVILFDVIWPAEYATNNILLDVTDRVTPEMNSGVLKGAWSTVEYQGKRYGMPWILDTKYLFYNRDILEKAGIAAPPKTWKELADQSAIIKAKGLVEFPIVWSWAQAEAVICDYTTLLSAFGGQFLDADGKPAFASGGGLAALQYMVDTTTAGLSNPNSKEYLEEDVRRVFENGEAAFALNWTYMDDLANNSVDSKVAGKVGIVPAPGVEGVSQISAMNGSMGLGVAATSKHPDQAWDFVTYLTSQSTQNAYAKLSVPIWASSYQDKAVTGGREELFAAAGTALAAMFPRPTTPNYQELSTVLQVAIQQALLGIASPQDALNQAVSDSGL
ncbi:multiple sugar transport system substrate-binding protein [Devosia sp. UYZn731]|uniref:extracellular solute-binding protein n=1 Tax=Devosia sp. UYZn731 TaxID=3156345 RepID=UPI0033931665